MRALYGIVWLFLGLTSSPSKAALHFLATNPTCQQPLADINYSVGVTRFLADYYVLVVENDHTKNEFKVTPTRLALQLVTVKRNLDSEVFTDKDGKMNFTIVRTSSGYVGILNWRRDFGHDLMNLKFDCGNAGNIFFEIKTRAEARLSVGN